MFFLVQQETAYIPKVVERKKRVSAREYCDGGELCRMPHELRHNDCGGLCRKSHELDTGGDLFILTNSKNGDSIDISIF
jgi:hypothetical protein